MTNHIHNYKTVKETEDGILQVCTECKNRISIKKDRATGRVDNKKYLKEHIRDTAQPHGKTSKIFKKYYPNAEII